MIAAGLKMGAGMGMVMAFLLLLEDGGTQGGAPAYVDATQPYTAPVPGDDPFTPHGREQPTPYRRI